MISVNVAKYVGKYNLQLTFNNGRKGMVNLENTLHKDIKKNISYIIKTYQNLRILK
jgi:hypothetical protein